jgi:light-regulated signal transduction histidine kinase (bacteriophytochrome)
MMGYKAVRCEHLKQKDQKSDSACPTNELYDKRCNDLVIDLVDPICVISNANEILSKRLSRFVDEETRSYFAMIEKATSKTKMIIDELRNEKTLI